MLGFERTRSFNDLSNANLVGLQGELDAKQSERLSRIRRYWNFYEGYHWEELAEQEGTEMTVNYCRAFVNKYVSFELGDSFTYGVHKNAENAIVTPDGKTLFEYIESVWVDNKQYNFSTEFGQMKSVTGESWVQVKYVAQGEEPDPFNKYPNGRIRLILLPTHTVFPEYAEHDRDRLVKVTIMYMYEATEQPTFLRGKASKKQVIYKQVWTDKECVIYDGDKEPQHFVNRYGFIPFVKTNNLDIAGKSEGVSDLEDLIPLNTAYNLKESNMSEILDYHAAPVTLVFGAKIGNLEKGANKLWGGMPKDAKVQNLELNGDLGASRLFAENLKLAMCEIGGMPESTLGGSQAISNTSGVALQYMNLPLIDRTKIKKNNTEDGIERINEMMLLVSLYEGLIFKPENLPLRELLYTEVAIPDTLPKDTLLELQQIQIEMQLGLENRKGAMRRLGKENIETYMIEIDREREEHPEFYGSESPQLNSGMTNGETPKEMYNKEVNGENRGQARETEL
jgi:hypothetical protein